jgi:acyl-CoA synthetase (AMP-forming)/AMP-acid ligase II
MGLGRSLADGGPPSATGIFEPGANVRVLDDAGADVVPGSGRPGRIAIRGFSPLGYHKDPARTAQTFVELDGDRYVIPGDYATLEADGTLRLLGRGSSCINTGGEKVYPEEVEAVIKELPGIADCAVVGVPDARFGSAVAAFVEPDPDVHIDEAAVVDHVKARLAGYKAPRHVLIAAVGRGPNGKVDHRVLQARAQAAAALA